MPRRVLSFFASCALTAVFGSVLCAAFPPTVLGQTASPKASQATAERIRKVESDVVSIPLSGGQPPLQMNLQQVMQALNVPGLSVAVIDDFRIAWTKAYGVTEAGTTTPVTPRTLFQAGSISKSVTAAGALFLVDQGKLSLDANVNQQLTTWKVPDNDFTATQKVTLRRILDHSAGLTVHGFPGYAVGDTIPTLVQIFNGEKPANTAPIRVDFVPGTKHRYSGGGTTIEQQLILDVTRKPFPQFMRETVLAPIGMTESTFEQPLPPALAAKAASGTRPDGSLLPGKWHIYPEMAAAGLWTTPTDLAKFAIEIALSKNGKSNRVLTEAMTRQMLTPQIEQSGLGVFLGMGGNPDAFGHNGADEGFQADLIMISDTGKGMAVMANSDNGLEAEIYLLDSIAKEYGWRWTPPKSSTASALGLVQKVKGTKAALEEYSYLKENFAAKYDFDESTLNQLGYQVLGAGQPEEAIQVFQLNVQEYPKSWNTYDSLGEAYMKAGKKNLAIQNYEMSVKLNPDNQNGIEALQKLKAK